MKARLLSCLWMLLLCTLVKAQDTATLAGTFSRRYAARVEQKADKIAAGLTRQSEKALKRLQRQQQRVYKSLYKLDSNAAKAYLQNSQAQCSAALSKLKNSSATGLQRMKTYVPGLDSMTGVLNYLDKLPGKSSLIGKDQLAGALSAASKAGSTLDGAAEVRQLMQQQAAQLRELASRYQDLHVFKQLKAYNKELYYYSQRLQEAKATLNDPARIEQAVLKLLNQQEGFRRWMQQNGQLAGLFGSAGGGGNMAQSLAGLQTRQSVQQALQSRMGGSVQQVQQSLNTAVQQAQGQMSNLRSRLQQLGSGSMGNGSGDLTLPDFKPNNQKTKSLLKRLEYGVNLQSQGRNRWQPSTTDIGLSLGYKLNDRSVVGVGAAYKLGWGAPIRHIRLSHQGMGLRSYVDYQLKGSLWLSGGYERNHRSGFRSIAELRGYNAWQHSGLIGFSKKVSCKGKKQLKIQLLYDFLRQPAASPQKPALLFRTGWTL